MPDTWTLRHLEAWIDRTVYPDEQDEVRTRILDLICDDPGLVDLGWPEVRRLAESH